jgi:hypothetical protein
MSSPLASMAVPPAVQLPAATISSWLQRYNITSAVGGLAWALCGRWRGHASGVVQPLAGHAWGAGRAAAVHMPPEGSTPSVARRGCPALCSCRCRRHRHTSTAAQGSHGNEAHSPPAPTPSFLPRLGSPSPLRPRRHNPRGPGPRPRLPRSPRHPGVWWPGARRPRSCPSVCASRPRPASGSSRGACFRPAWPPAASCACSQTAASGSARWTGHRLSGQGSRSPTEVRAARACLLAAPVARLRPPCAAGSTGRVCSPACLALLCLVPGTSAPDSAAPVPPRRCWPLPAERQGGRHAGAAERPVQRHLDQQVKAGQARGTARQRAAQHCSAAGGLQQCTGCSLYNGAAGLVDLAAGPYFCHQAPLTPCVAIHRRLHQRVGSPPAAAALAVRP